jgi:hypothetical protein
MATITVLTVDRKRPTVSIRIPDGVFDSVVTQLADAFAGGSGCWLNRDADIDTLEGVAYWIPATAVVMANPGDVEPTIMFLP